MSLKLFIQKRLSVQLILIVVIVSLFVLGVTGWYRYQQQSTVLKTKINQHTSTTVDILAVSLSVPVYNYDFPTIKTICLAIMKNPNVIQVGIEGIKNLDLIYIKQSNGKIKKVTNSDILPLGEIYKRPIINDNKEIGVIAIKTTKHLLNIKLEEIRNSLLIQIIVLELLLITPLIFLLRYRFIIPIQRLIKNTACPIDIVFDKKGYGNTELGDLAQEYFQMRDNIRKTINSLNVEVDERKLAEAELKKAQNYISNIINSMPSILIGVNTDAKITQWNNTAQKVTGITAMKAKGKLLAVLFPSMATEIIKIKESIATHEIKKDLHKIRETLDGTHYENITIYPLIADNVQGAVIRIDDVTKEHHLEEQLLQSRKMEAIGQLSGGVAHDFNNMLAGILGAAQLLKSPQKKLDKKSIQYVEMIIQAVNRAADLTAKLLTFSRKGKLGFSTIDLHNVVDDTMAIFKRTIDKKINILLLKEATNHKILGDNTALQTTLLNLGINSSHAMSEGGKLKILTRNIELDEKYCEASPFEIAPGEYIELEISDSGVGISSENLSKIFDPFFTTKDQGKGTGLGLSTVYGTVQDHHGAITVYSESGRGTIFHLYLPCSDKSIDIVKKDKNLISGSGVILLVDDEELILTTGEYLLREMGYEIIIAKNGLEAVNIFKKRYNEIDLIIMDMIMPEMNGREAFYKMKEIDHNCKVIISSGFTKNEDLSKLKNDGLAGFLNKPFRDYELSQLLNDILKSKADKRKE